MTPIFKQIQKWRFIRLYKRLWPFVKPFWGRCLLSVLITIPIGALDAVMTLALKPFTDSVLMSGEGKTPWGLPLWIIPLGIILFTIVQSALEYGASSRYFIITGNHISFPASSLLSFFIFSSASLILSTERYMIL